MAHRRGLGPAFMNVFTHFQSIVREIVESWDAAAVAGAPIVVEPPRDPEHGDLATNAALVLAKKLGARPRDLGLRLAAALAARDDVVAADVAGPGFVNLRLSPAFWHARLREILHAGTSYGDTDNGAGKAVNVEYVSANPTGPLHVGHARGAVVGDALATLLAKAGYAVTREYYINDAGAQVEQLAYSAYVRYLQALGEAVDEDRFGTMFPGKEWAYRGDYLVAVGEALAGHYERKLAGVPDSDWLPVVKDFAVAAMMDLIRDDLAALGVRQGVFTSERALVEAGAVEAALAALDAAGLIYTGTLEPPKGKTPDDWEPRPQTLFRATQFGDDVDRPLKKSDGSWTYFATDLAYHRDKWQRGFHTLINVWGADHAGYVKRMAAGVRALSGAAAELDVKTCQLVRLLEAGVPAKMSKRAGTYVMLSDLVERVGKDVVRFIMLTRRNDAPLDFDFIAVQEKSRDNPVFYVQYAHARCRSVMRHAHDSFAALALTAPALADAALERLTDSDELALIRLLASWPRVVEGAALAHEPHRVAYYLGELAASFHGLWTKGKGEARLRFLIDDDSQLTLARLALVQAVATVIASGLAVIGVEPMEEMRE